MAGLLDFLQSASNAAASNVAGPIDLLGWALNKAGVPVGVPVGGSEWMKRKGLMRDVPQSAVSLAGETVGLLSPVVAAAKAPQIAAGLLAGQDAAKKGAVAVGRQASDMAGDYMARQGLLQPATVWHGSPHKFDKFDSSKIGTGEGAQAYGHGLYLAESPDVANAYQYNLGYQAGNMPKIAGKDIGDYYNAFSDKANRLPPALAAKEYDKLAMLEDLMGQQATPASVLADAAQRQYPAHAVEWFKKTIVPKYEAPGNLYKVDLPDSAIARMLDWDKPLSQQAPAVRDAIQKAYGKEWDKVKDINGGQFYTRSAADDPWGATGQRGKGQQEADAKWLRGLGIPGIRYLDGGSRGAGQGTSNYVVFPGEEGLLTILERNGKPIGLLGE